MNKSVKLYRADGSLIENKTFPNLDPTFFFGGVTPSGIGWRDVEKKPYQYHSWVYSCASTIAKNVSRLPKVILETRGEKTTETEDHPVLDLFSKPNDYMDGTAFFWFTVLNLMLPTSKTTGGQCFLIPVDRVGRPVNLAKGQIPHQIFPFSDETISAKINKKTKELEAWVYKVPGIKAKTKSYKPEELIRIYLPNPYNVTKGLSPYSAGEIAVRQDVKADELNTRYFDNNATLGGVLTSDQELSKEQRDEMLKAWMETYGGPGNVGGMAVLGLGLKYEQFARTHRDMLFTDQKTLNKEQIISVYGLNKIALGMYEELNLATIKEGRKLLWHDTYLPIDRLILSAINNQWLVNIDNGTKALSSDTTNVESLRDDIESKVNIMTKMVKEMGIPVEEAARIVELPIDTDKYPWLKTVFVSAMLVDASKVVGSGVPAGLAPQGASVQTKNDSKREEELDRFSDQYIRTVLTPSEKRMSAQMTRFFNKQRNEMQDRVDEWLKKEKVKTVTKQMPPDPRQFLFDMVKANTELKEIYTPFVRDQMLVETGQLEDELGGLVNWSVNPDTINEVLEGRLKRITVINTTTFKQAGVRIGEIISEGVEQQWTVDQMAKELKAGIFEVAQVRVHNAKTIARTEIGTISSTTRFKAFKAEQVRRWEWVTARDERVRPLHAETHGHTTEVGKLFHPVGLRFPLDPAGSPENVINCRCVTVAVEE